MTLAVGEISPTAGASNFTYTYDDSGRITEVRAGGVLRYKYVYDESGQVALDYNFTDNTATKYVYDANGTINTSTYGNGDTVSYTYDSLDRVIATSYNGISTYESEYNREGLLTKSVDAENNVTTVYDYDFARRLFTKSNA